MASTRKSIDRSHGALLQATLTSVSFPTATSEHTVITVGSQRAGRVWDGDEDRNTEAKPQADLMDANI